MSFIFRTEEEIGLDNLKLIEVPAHYSEKFHKIDEELLKNY